MVLYRALAVERKAAGFRTEAPPPASIKNNLPLASSAKSISNRYPRLPQTAFQIRATIGRRQTNFAQLSAKADILHARCRQRRRL